MNRRRRPGPFRRLTTACVAVMALVAGVGCRQSGDWNETFHRSEGWWFSDGGGSAELPNGKTVWLFGDTWLRNNGDVLFNSMAVQDTAPGRAPRPNEIRFFGRDRRGALADVTTMGERAARSWAEPTDKDAATTWLWPTSALSAGGKLIAMYVEVGCLVGDFPGCRTSLANMDVEGNSVVVVQNPTDDPERWKVHTTKLRDRGDRPPRAHRLHWGSALFEEGGWLYVFGVGLGARTVPEDVKVARVTPDQVARYDQWQFLTPRGWQMIPTGPKPEELRSLARGGSTELSVHRVVRDGEARFVMVQVDPFAQEIIVRTAAGGSIESVRWSGPHEEPGVRRYSLAALDPKTAGGMNWAGRAHPHHSTGDALLVSYYSERLHSLRFVELPLSEAMKSSVSTAGAKATLSTR